MDGSILRDQRFNFNIGRLDLPFFITGEGNVIARGLLHPETRIRSLRDLT